MKLQLDALKQYFDVVRSRDGAALRLRFVEPRDAEELQNYVRSLSVRSRYNRFLGAISELPKSVLDRFTHPGEADQFTLVATMMMDGFETIVGELRYALHVATNSVEFGLSIDDQWQGHGFGNAMLANLECRAAALGADRLFGDILRSNDAMIGLVRKSGFEFVHHPDDWKLVRVEKHIALAPAEIPCASWRLAAQNAAFDQIAAS